MSLTHRQSQIVQLLAQGNTAEQCAAALHRSVTTVRRHVVLACEKTQARNTAHLIAIAISRGWIAPLALALMLADLHSMSLRARQPVRTRQQVVASYRTARRDLEVLA